MEIMAELTKEYALAQGLLPYYLYRQRYTVGDLENIGYAKPGTESGYNVFMMEERQSIIALGGGGITKFVYPDETVVRVINPKCSATYAQNLGKLLEEKKAALTKWCKEGLNC
jgi:oxygen-independent coproporphyrinogen-3 oxidase